ncbi:MAG: S41 family peptidase [Candidatus Rokuibacteriota bacterium]
MRARILAVAVLVLTLTVWARPAAAQHGSLALTAPVSGVEVWLDDRRLGEARADSVLVVPNVPAGTHLIVAKKGARTWERAVEIAADDQTRVSIQIDVPGPAPSLRLLAEVAAHVDASYVTQPDFAEFRLGALRGLEKVMPEGAFTVAVNGQGAAITYRGPPPGGNTRILFAPPTTREDAFRDLSFVASLAREIAPAVQPARLEQVMAQGAIGILDAHSSFLDRDSYKEVQVEISGTFAGVGMELTRKDDALTVVAPIDGTPAHRAGIQAGDRLVSIDGVSTTGMTLPDAVKRIRGKPGTKVAVGIVREGGPAAREFEIVREQIHVQSVQSRELGPGIGYVRIRTFQEKTVDDLGAALAAWKDGALAGLVLDLRNNPGGLLTAAVGVAEKFLDPPRLIVYTQGRVKNQNVRFNATGKKHHAGFPVVVLVNNGSASASEIVAGALQDWSVAVLVGTKTFGKGSVQTIIPLSDGSALRLTTARYFTPKGRSIDGTGLEPETVVAPGDPATQGPAADPQLQRALAELRTRIVSKAGR